MSPGLATAPFPRLRPAPPRAGRAASCRSAR